MLHIPARYQTVSAILLAFVTGSVEAGDTMIFVVRHAEKKQDIDRYLRIPREYLRLPDHVKDAHIPLRSEGTQRAIDFRDLFRAAGIKLDAVYATRFLRTWQTGAPSAKAAGVEVTAPEFNAQLISRLRSGDLGKNILIVGHSGSVEEIVGQLSGTVVPRIGNEYDNLFEVKIQDGQATVTHRRYGGEIRELEFEIATLDKRLTHLNERLAKLRGEE